MEESKEEQGKELEMYRKRADYLDTKVKETERK